MFYKIKQISILIIFVIMLCATTLANAEESITLKESENMTVYSIFPNVFRNFLDNPSMAFLSDNSKEMETYSKSIQKEGCIKRTVSSNPVQIDEFPEGWYVSIGNLPVYPALIEFFSNTEAIQGFLMENGVTDKIESIVLVNGSFARSIGIPLTAWIKTLHGHYFITIEVNLMPELYGTGHYMYQLYSYMDYKNKFGLKDGTLIVNETDITEGHYFKLQNTGAYLPFRAVMEQLGANIEWISTRNAVLMNCNGKRYILETKPMLRLFEEGDESDLLLPPPGEEIVYSYEMIHDRIIMDNETMQKCTALMNANVEVDIDNLLVTIK